jgi:predicted naringenin-chalcone synthase
MLLGAFRPLRPRHRSTQGQTLEWLAQAHTEAEAHRARTLGRSFEPEAFLHSMRRRLARFGCSDDKIATRGHESDDCSHLRWDEMEIYRLREQGEGLGMAARTKAFGRIAGAAFEQLYEEATAPKHLIHVTCTGYESPSAAQRLVTAKGWGSRTRVTHAYHMGCYAALPALRIAAGFAASRGADGDARVDLVHTELCSLHLHPLRHEPEQLVIQSLFADGCIAYSLYPDEGAGPRGAALALLSHDEWLLPDSAESMAWFCSDFGMEMVLARDVPEKIGKELSPFVDHLLQQAGRGRSDMASAVFAVHPGGPKIVDQVASILELTDAQVAFSRDVLREHGNMSSATLPHIWERIVSAPSVSPGALVVNLAFGPGLTLSGAVLRKVEAA